MLAHDAHNDAFEESLAAALIEAAHVALGVAWGCAQADLEPLTEIPPANASDPPRALLPLVQCLLIGAALGREAALATSIPMLDDIGKHIWSETDSELAALFREIVARLGEVKKHSTASKSHPRCMRCADSIPGRGDHRRA